MLAVALYANIHSELYVKFLSKNPSVVCPLYGLRYFWVENVRDLIWQQFQHADRVQIQRLTIVEASNV